MVQSNAQLLSKLDSAFKAITEVTDLGDAILQPEKAARFVQEMELATRVLPAARFISMQSQQRDIDRISLTGRIIKSGKGSDGTHRTLSTSDYADPTFSTNKLITNELVAIISLRDDTLRENIEKGNLETTLVSLFGQAAGRDFEEYAIFADTGVAFADDDMLSKSDNWASLAANKIYGRNTTGDTQVAADFDPEGASFPENMFQAQLDGLPKKYFGDPSQWRFYVSFAVEDAYRDILRARGTDLGDTSQTQRAPVYYKGIQVVYTPLLERAPAVTAGDTGIKTDVVEGDISILVNPSNLVWGVFHQVRIEPEREAKERRTDFVLTFEADAHYEDENAVVVAFVDKANPTAAA